ncbi:MAG: hypothetical protein PHQ04_04035 [Opitutaceae bacterium]|nr:hypothetical protein [Opitutaceae bacterium]
MKTILLFLLVSGSAFAQWIVNDPVNTAVNTVIQGNQVAQHAEILRQWALQIDRLNEQIRQLRDQLAEVRHMREVLGDPSTAGAEIVLRELGADELGRAYGETATALRRLVDTAESLRNTMDDTVAPLDDRTALGRPFARQSVPYRRYAAVEQMAANLEHVQALGAARRAALQRDLAETMELLRTAGTQAEVDKLQAKISALNGQLAAVDGQQRQAAAQLQAQQILNDNQAAKERQDLLEKQVAEERETLAAFGAWQAGMKLMPTSYTQP